MTDTPRSARRTRAGELPAAASPTQGHAPEAAATGASRRDRRRERTREEILDAARQVLARDGIAGTTLDAVAREMGVTKPALYYYFTSKDALLFEVVFATLQRHARSVHDAVEAAPTGADALGAIVRETVGAFASRMDEFRVAFLQPQVAGSDAVTLAAGQLERIRPLNDQLFAGAAARVARDRAGGAQGRAPVSAAAETARRRKPAHDSARGRASSGVDPRLMAFLAYLAALGLLTMKGMVETVDDPLRYRDQELIDGFSRVFAAAG